MACRWIKDAKAPGGRFHVPGCMGCAVYGLPGCTCTPVSRRRETEDRLARLEEKVKKLEREARNR